MKIYAQFIPSMQGELALLMDDLITPILVIIENKLK
jgi:hypothetical protein